MKEQILAPRLSVYSNGNPDLHDAVKVLLIEPATSRKRAAVIPAPAPATLGYTGFITVAMQREWSVFILYPN